MNLVESARTPPKPMVGQSLGFLVLIAGCALASACFLHAYRAWLSLDEQLSLIDVVPTVAPTIIGGLVLLLGAGAFYRFSRREQAAYAHRLAHADAPWRWRREWNQPVITSQNMRGLWAFWIFNLGWNSISWTLFVLTWRLPREQPVDYLPVGFVSLFVLIGLVMLTAAVYLQLKRFKYGVPRFRPSTWPGEIGGHLRGRIEIPARIRLLDGEQVELVLRCVRLVSSGIGKDRHTTETTLWESTRRLSGVGLAGDSPNTVLPVDFDIPTGLPESSWGNPLTSTEFLEWRLLAKARTRGVDLNTEFAVPVYLTEAARELERRAGVSPAKTLSDREALKAVKIQMSASGPSVRLGASDYLRVLLQNGIPAFGVVFLGWSVTLILLLYWLENLFGSIFWNRLIRRHEAATHKRGHYRNQFGVSSNGRELQRFASEHAAGTIFFTLGHGVFLFVFAFIILDGSALLEDLFWVVVLSCAVVATLFLEIRPLHQNLEQRSFAWLREQARVSFWPVTAMHLGVILGAVALGGSGMTLALIFIGLRVIVDLGRAWFRNNPGVSAPPVLPPEAGQSELDRKLYELKLAAYEAHLMDEEICPPEERGRR